MIDFKRNEDVFDKLPNLNDYGYRRYRPENFVYKAMFLMESPLTQRQVTDKINETWGQNLHQRSLSSIMCKLVQMDYLEITRRVIPHPYIYEFTPKFIREKKEYKNNDR